MCGSFKKKIIYKTARKTIRAKQKSPIWVKKFKGQEVLFNAMSKFIFVWEWQNHQYLQLNFIPSLQSDIIPVSGASLHRSNGVVQLSHQLPHMNFPIGEGNKSSYMSGLADTGAGLNLMNIEYH